MRGLCTLVAALGIACSTRSPYRCADSSQCGSAGVCEPTGYCSVVDPSCPGGRKYEEHAGDGLAGTCLDAMPPPPVDAVPTACGGAGEPCCTEAAAACGDHLACRAGTCESCVDDIGFGRHFACVRRDDATVWCAGENNAGQIGVGLASSTYVLEWTQVKALATTVPISDATGFAAGWEHACAIREGGTVWCWGANNHGQLGRGDTVRAAAAVQVLVEPDGAPLANIVEIVAGDDHGCGRDQAGAVWCWGRNDAGQLGDGTTTSPRTRAVAVLDGPMGAPISGAVALTAAADHACLRNADGATWCWGSNQQGVLGDGTLEVRSSPVLVGRTQDIDAGTYALTCRVELDGTASCHGSSWRYRLGDGRSNSPNGAADYAALPSPVLVERDGAKLAGVKQIVVGGVPCALLVDGSVRCWGDNSHGQNGTGAVAPFPTPVRLADGRALDGVTRLVGHFAHFCAVRDTGAIVCWGRGLNGEQGNGELADVGRATPLRFTCP